MGVELQDRIIGPNENSGYNGRVVSFEKISIQWDKGKWEFQHPREGFIIKPTYPILNPTYWSEIAHRLDNGETAAVFMLGNFGVVKKLEAPEWEDPTDKGSADALFDKVKKRPRQQNFVALAHPEDVIDVIDIDRVDKSFRSQLRSPFGRERLYVGPLHVILPVRDKGFINQALIRQEDKTIAVFWANHFGFEGLVAKARKVIKHGILGGGSLNVHGKDPCYNKKELYEEMSKQQDWLEEIDFIVFDDIVEAANIGRSHTMISYSTKHPELVRVGSLSIGKIEERLGRTIRVFPNPKYASSNTPYSEESNALADRKVEEALLQVGRFENHLRSSINL